MDVGCISGQVSYYVDYYSMEPDGRPHATYDTTVLLTGYDQSQQLSLDQDGVERQPLSNFVEDTEPDRTCSEVDFNSAEILYSTAIMRHIPDPAESSNRQSMDHDLEATPTELCPHCDDAAGEALCDSACSSSSGSYQTDDTRRQANSYHLEGPNNSFTPANDDSCGESDRGGNRQISASFVTDHSRIQEQQQLLQTGGEVYHDDSKRLHDVSDAEIRCSQECNSDNAETRSLSSIATAAASSSNSGETTSYSVACARAAPEVAEEVFDEHEAMQQQQDPENQDQRGADTKDAELTRHQLPADEVTNSSAYISSPGCYQSDDLKRQLNSNPYALGEPVGPPKPIDSALCQNN